MEIVIFGAVDFPAGPASTSRVKNIAKILVAAGNRVTVASLQANTKTPYPENTSTEGEVDSIRYTYLSGNLVRPSGLSGAVLDSAKGCLGACGLLWKRCREKSVDLVLFYTPDFFQILPPLALAKLFGIPIVMELCEINSTSPAANFRQRVRLISALLTDRALPKLCAGIIVISSRIGDLLLASGIDPAKIFHLPALVDCQKFAKKSGASIPMLVNKKYFLNSGVLGEKDGYEYLLGAFALFCRKHDSVFLAFTGEPDPSRKGYVVNLARDLGIERRVVFTGFLSHDQLIWSYQNAIALLCCRNNSRFANFGSPTKLSEYLSSGKPVITNEVGDNKRYLEKNKNAFFARVEDPSTIAEQMERIFTSPLVASQVGKEGQKVAQEHFHYGNHVLSLNRFLDGLSKVA